MSSGNQISLRSASQDAQERAIAEVYIRWLARRQGIHYKIARATDVFPHLADRGDWEFVARPNNGEDWIGIEIKALVVADAYSRTSQWESIWIQVGRDIGDDLNGSYAAIGPSQGERDLHPSWPPRALRQSLISAIETAVLSHVPTMVEGDQVDIGPEILKSFRDWPLKVAESIVEHDGEGRLTRNDVMYPPCEMILIKTTESGRDIGFVATPTQFYPGSVDLDDFHRNIKKAGTQLGRARDRGATRTVLLLDDRRSTPPDSITSARWSIPTTDFNNIDDMFLVHSNPDQITMV